MRIFFFVPDGTGVKNYLFSDIIKQLKGHTVGLYHHLPETVTTEIGQLHQEDLELHQIPAFYTNKIQRFMGDLATLARLHRNSRIKKNPRIWRSQIIVKNPKGFYKFYYYSIAALGWPISLSYKAIRSLDRLLAKSYSGNDAHKTYQQLLAHTKPDVIICTHQRMQEAGLMAEIAKSLGIPVVTAIFSWDNLPKSRIALKADTYIVWSDYMKKEMAWYYPEIQANNVIVTGTPQFEFSEKKHLLWSKEFFCTQLGVPANKKLILFSGNDGSSPNDRYYLEDVAEAVAAMPEASRPLIILRRAPVDRSNRFDEVVKKYATIIHVSEPLWTSEADNKTWFSILPTYNDVILLTNLCMHCDLVMNIGSTMGLDFAHFNKPAIYINYEKPYNQEWYNIGFIYGLEHFKTLDNLDAVLWVKSKEEIAHAIEFALQHPEKAGSDRLKWKYLLTNDIKDASKRIAQLLLEMAQRK